jgi:hypothetical protein
MRFLVLLNVIQFYPIEKTAAAQAQASGNPHKKGL